jgi:hypothetical protein
MRKLILAVVSAAVLAVPGVAAAGDGWGTQPGYDVSNAVSCNADHGAFGAFDGDHNLGHGGTPVYHDGAVGQETGATGSNNSTFAAGCRAA